ncbi:MAG TPA: PIN domain-containing protein [Candidatus Binatia bacterium]
MIAFFDSCIHIDLLTGALSFDQAVQKIGSVPVRLSPVVASELLRGVSKRPRSVIERLVRQLVPIEPPSWRQCWYDAGRLLPEVFRNHEEIGLSRLQNDLLLALTARHTGALFVTTDGHFAALRRLIAFRLVTL